MNTRVYLLFLVRKNISQIRERLGKKTTFSRTTSTNQRVQTKTPKKEHVSMVSQAECETCFRTNILIFTLIFSCSG